MTKHCWEHDRGADRFDEAGDGDVVETWRCGRCGASFGRCTPPYAPPRTDRGYFGEGGVAIDEDCDLLVAAAVHAA